MRDGVRLIRVRADAPRLVWEVHTRTERVAYLDAVDGDLLWVSHIGVEPRFRRLGHATRLLHAVLAHARSGPVALTAAPFPSWREQGLLHEDLRTWYARHGFHPAPTPQDPYRMIRPAAPSVLGAGLRDPGGTCCKGVGQRGQVIR
ncbi:GNAT family N-acetyltransferase [Streptomyces longwoodensis]|uniref:GNAT family N-acetyltransferase n=1 Tax=Streptomyces longwoodensis TaxID=68231 RepID=UPI00340AB034